LRPKLSHRIIYSALELEAFFELQAKNLGINFFYKIPKKLLRRMQAGLKNAAGTLIRLALV